MSKKYLVRKRHPKGNRELAATNGQVIALNAYGINEKVVWDREASVTQSGQIPFFIDFIPKTAVWSVREPSSIVFCSIEAKK